MVGQWDKVARWAGISNNGEDSSSTRGADQMVEDTMVNEVEENQVAGDGTSAPRTIEAGSETPLDPSAAGRVDLEQLRGERDQLLDRLVRLQAEFENARRREAKERSDAREYTISNTVEAFLPVMDNFQLALQADGTVEQLRGGVQLILKQMEEALRGLNVQTIETVGTQFDPRIHEALGSIETSESPDHQVLEEIRRGYKIRDKLLRPALVRIASNTSQVAE